MNLVNHCLLKNVLPLFLSVFLSSSVAYKMLQTHFSVSYQQPDSKLTNRRNNTRSQNLLGCARVFLVSSFIIVSNLTLLLASKVGAFKLLFLKNWLTLNFSSFFRYLIFRVFLWNFSSSGLVTTFSATLICCILIGKISDSFFVLSVTFS